MDTQTCLSRLAKGEISELEAFEVLQHSSTEELEVCFDYGIPNHEPEICGNALHLVSELGMKSLIQLCFTKQVNQNIVDKVFQYTALHLLWMAGHTHLIRFMLENKVDPNAQNRNGNSVFHFFCDFPNREMPYEDLCDILDAFLSYGAELYLPNDDGLTPIGYAHRSNYYDLFKWLNSSSPTPVAIF